VRSLSGTLNAEQKEMSVTPLIKVVFSHNATEHEYDLTRLLSLKHSEEAYSHKLELVLQNSDGVLTALDLKGFQAQVSFGLTTGSGDEYSACAPQWVLWQQLESSPGALSCELRMVGIPNLLAEDKASVKYMPEAGDTKAVKTLINQILGGTLTCFNHCKAWEVVYDSEDDLIATYQPKNGFRIYLNTSRLASVRMLLDFTKCVMRYGADGKIHILNPTISGESYDYQYSLDSGHTFFAKAHRKSLVIPNYIHVSTPEDAEAAYSGFALDQDSIDAIGYAIRQHEQCSLISNDQATHIAEAILSKYRLWSEIGSAAVPMNVGAEIFDYVKVTDERQEDYRIGNIGVLERRYQAAMPSPLTGAHKQAEFFTVFSFGGWLSMRELVSTIETYPSSFGSSAGSYFNKLSVKDLYAENLTAKNIDLVWLDPDNTIDLSEIGDTLDNLPDGEVFARVKSIHIDAEGGIKLDENIIYKEGYDPSLKEKNIVKSDTAPEEPVVGDLWCDTSVTPNIVKRWTGTEWVETSVTDIDDLDDGLVYQRAKSAALNASGLVLLDQLVIGSIYGLVNKADISAGHIKLSSVEQSTNYQTVTGTDKGYWDGKPENMDEIGQGSSWLKVANTEISAGHIKIYNSTVFAGTWYSDGAGVEIDATTGIKIGGSGALSFYYAGAFKGVIRADTSLMRYGTTGIGHRFTGDYIDMPQRSSAPSGYLGRHYYDTSLDRPRVYAYGAWRNWGEA